MLRMLVDGSIGSAAGLEQLTVPQRDQSQQLSFLSHPHPGVKNSATADKDSGDESMDAGRRESGIVLGIFAWLVFNITFPVRSAAQAGNQLS